MTPPKSWYAVKTRQIVFLYFSTIFFSPALRVQLYGKGLVRKLGFPSFDRSENYVNDKIVLLRAEGNSLNFLVIRHLVIYFWKFFWLNISSSYTNDLATWLYLVGRRSLVTHSAEYYCLFIYILNTHCWSLWLVSEFELHSRYITRLDSYLFEKGVNSHISQLVVK